MRTSARPTPYLVRRTPHASLIVAVFLVLGALVLAATPALALPDLTVDLIAGAAEPVAAGEEFNYRVIATNQGDPATAVAVTVTLPATITYLADDGACTFAAPTLTCTIGAFAADATRGIRIMVRINPDAALPNGGAFLPLTAAIDGAEADADATDDSDSLSTLVNERAELRITTIVLPTGSIHAGELFQYSILVDNYGPSVAREVLIRDTLFAGVTPPADDLVTIQSCAFSVSQGKGAITQFTCTTGPVVGTQFGTDAGLFRTNVLWPIDPDPDGDPLTDDARMPGRLRASFRVITSVGVDPVNTATVAAVTPDPDPSNNMAVALLEILPAADLSVALSATGEEQQVNQAGQILNNAIFGQAFPTAPNYFASIRVTAGRRIQYTLTVTNNGPSNAENAVLSSRLPAGVRIYQGSLTAPPGVNCETGTPGEPLDRLTCGLGTILADNPAVVEDPPVVTTRTISFQVVTDASLEAGTVIDAEARVASDAHDAVNGNDQAFVQNTVLAAADLRVFKATAASTNPGTLLRYEVAVQNNGPSDSRSVTIHEVLPPTDQVELVSVDGAECVVDAAAANVLTCAVGDLPAGARRTLGVAVMVNPLATPPLTQNCATALSGLSNTVPPGTPPAPPTGGPTETLTWDPSTADNLACANAALIPDGTIFGLADIAVTLGTDPEQFAPGQEVAYLVQVTNNGPLAAEDVRVTDELPAGFTLTAVDLGGGPGSCTIAGELTCALGPMIAGEVRSFTILGYVKRKIPSEAVLSNGVAVDSASLDFVPENNFALVTTVVRVGNIVKNGGFEVAVTDPPWTPGALDPGDGQDCLVAHGGSCSFAMSGPPADKRIRQDLVFNGRKGDLITASGWAKAQGVSGPGACRLEVRALLATGWRTIATKQFTKGTHDWQKRAVSVKSRWNFRALAVVAKFGNLDGEVWFDDVTMSVRPGALP